MKAINVTYTVLRLQFYPFIIEFSDLQEEIYRDTKGGIVTIQMQLDQLRAYSLTIHASIENDIVQYAVP